MKLLSIDVDRVMFVFVRNAMIAEFGPKPSKVQSMRLRVTPVQGAEVPRVFVHLSGLHVVLVHKYAMTHVCQQRPPCLVERLVGHQLVEYYKQSVILIFEPRYCIKLPRDP